ncbi:MAG: VacB/RNase II family 3'-5' exoribonuclease [Acidobacteria bacterium]|nr:VacB/RNase II family 3'-5' exoribonuclease [Acidobacteriota bacterium]
MRPRSPKQGPKPLRHPLPRGGKLLGRLVCHRDGYGFVIPETSLPNVQGDIFIGENGMGSALHGDRVQVANVRVKPNGRAEGRILKVLERAHEAVVGEFHYGFPQNYVVPYEQRIPHKIVIPKGEEVLSGKAGKTGTQGAGKPSLAVSEGSVVNVAITRYPTLTQPASGRVLEILGQSGDFGVDVEIIIRKHHLPHEFPSDVLGEAQKVPAAVPAEALRSRGDFRHLPIVTIDGETAKDFDDAVAVFPLPNGHFQLQVHIADVSHYVRPGTALDREARLRGTSVYFPDRAVPMLPPELSSGICSLKPAEDRLTLSVLMEIDRQGEILEAEFCKGVIRSAERMTYTAVNAVLESDPQMRSRYSSLATHFEQMRDLALLLNKKRRRLGAIDFDLPEPAIEFDELGVMVAIVRSERNIAHRLIEEFMLAANEAVASYLDHLGLSTLYRVHAKPDPLKVVEFEEIAAAFGYSLGVGPLPLKRFVLGRERHGRQRPSIELPAGKLEVSPRHYQRLSDKIAGKPEERILSYLMLRSLPQAHYDAQNEGHFALAIPCYTHFTSPIRRYPDLIVHRILRALLSAGEVPAKLSAARTWIPQRRPLPPDPISSTELQEIALESSEAERRADDAERELIEWKKSRFMRQKLGEEFDALIISVTKSGFFVELADLFVEGLVPIETLTDQQYVYRERERQWVGERTRRRFRIGDRLRVRLDRAGTPGEKMNFSVVF